MPLLWLTFGVLLSVFEFEKQMYMTKDEVLIDVENLVNGLMDSSPFGQVYNDGFKDGANYAMQKLQQYDCSKLLELLEQMSKEENEALGKAGYYQLYKREKHSNQKYCLAIVMQMIKERQPIA
jgi:hypothetical protein